MEGRTRLGASMGMSLILLAACSGATEASTTADPSTTTTSSSTTTTLPPPTTTTTAVDTCSETIDEQLAAFDAVLDSADADPLAFAENAGDSLNQLFGEMGKRLVEDCGVERSAGAYSDLVVYLSNERSTRASLTNTFIDGLLTSFCEGSPFVLTVPAQAVCVSAVG